MKRKSHNEFSKQQTADYLTQFYYDADHFFPELTGDVCGLLTRVDTLTELHLERLEQMMPLLVFKVRPLHLDHLPSLLAQVLLLLDIIWLSENNNVSLTFIEP